jgi:hypothetical protein
MVRQKLHRNRRNPMSAAARFAGIPFPCRTNSPSPVVNDAGGSSVDTMAAETVSLT